MGNFIINRIFGHKLADKDKLLKYGFKAQGERLAYVTDIMEGQFELRAEVSLCGDISARVIDRETGEEYAVFLVEEAQGSFVGAMREEYERVLTDIAEHCFYDEVFKSDSAKRVIAYVRERYGDKLEFLWERLPDCAVWRRKDNRKWYGAMLTVSRRKLGLDGDAPVTILDLRIAPEEIDGLVAREGYFYGYHMNKRHWFSVLLDGSVPAEEIERHIDNSYVLAKKK